MSKKNNKFSIGDELNIEGRVYDVCAFATDQDGVTLVLVDGWGERLAYYDAEIQRGIIDGTIETVS